MAFDTATLHHLAASFGLPPLSASARQPGVISALQITAASPSGRLRHSVARVIEFQQAAPRLEIVYEGINRHRPLQLPLSRDRLAALQAVLSAVQFDRLRDQPQLSWQTDRLWLLQRAAGTHAHSIIVAPDQPLSPYSTLVRAITAQLPAAIRPLPLQN